MEYILPIAGLLSIIIGIFGSFLPLLPGPPVAWFGLLLLNLTPGFSTNYWILGITLIFALIIAIADYTVPAKGTKRFGGSKYGIWGTNIGLIIGIFTPIPMGFIVGPFLGALTGELIYNSKDKNRALKAATGSFIGFLAGTFIKFVFCMVLLGVFMYQVIENNNVWK